MLVLVQRTSWPTADAVPGLVADTGPIALLLDARCVLDVPRAAAAVGVADLEPRLSDGVTLVAGYNIQVTAATKVQDLRTTTRLSISAVPGAGLGRYPGCDESNRLVRTINHVAPDTTGNIDLVATGCHWVRPPVLFLGGAAVPVAAALQVGNDCTACCDCGEFEAAQAAVLSTWDRYAQAAAARDRTQADYEALLSRWLAEKSCRESQPVTLNAIAHHDHYVEIVAAACNHSDSCARNVQIYLGISPVPADTPLAVDYQAGTLLVTGSNQTKYTPTLLGSPPAGTEALALGTWYQAAIDAVPTHGNAVLRLRALVPNTVFTSPLWLKLAAYTNLGPAGAATPPVAKMVNIR
jgi:hypothetical protein